MKVLLLFEPYPLPFQMRQCNRSTSATIAAFAATCAGSSADKALAICFRCWTGGSRAATRRLPSELRRDYLFAMTVGTPRKLYLGTIIPLVAVLAAVIALVSYSPTLYRLFCAATGLAGTTQRSLAAPAADDASAAGQEITVRFDSNVDKSLDWDFRPAQSSVRVRFGVPTEAFFIARNRSDKTIVGRAVYNVTPYQVAPYFFKIQCFCFTDEKLGPGETAKMPVVFYVDKAFAKDPEMRLFSDITLSYTFYRKKDLTPEALRQARDLSEGSRVEATAIGGDSRQSFANDAPRR